MGRAGGGGDVLKGALGGGGEEEMGDWRCGWDRVWKMRVWAMGVEVGVWGVG